VRGFAAGLFMARDDGDVELIRHTSLRIASDPMMQEIKGEDGWLIDDPMSSFRWYWFWFDIPRKMIEELSGEHFFRLRMDAVGQSSQHADFFVNNWSDAFGGVSNITLRQPEAKP
jgi:hypothetical protein